MTAATGTPTSTRPQIDEHTEADLQPGCEVVELHVCIIHGTAEPHPCTAPATWVARTACTCGATQIVLLCEPHLHAAQHLVGRCKQCHQTVRITSAERI